MPNFINVFFIVDYQNIDSFVMQVNDDMIFAELVFKFYSKTGIDPYKNNAKFLFNTKDLNRENYKSLTELGIRNNSSINVVFLENSVIMLQEVCDSLQNKLNIANNNIKELQNKLNNATNLIKDYKKLNEQKDLDINNYKEKLEQKESELNNLKNQSKNITNLKPKIYCDEMMCVNFISTNQKVYFAVPCAPNNTFAEIEEKLYKKYPEYRETNNNFLANGKLVLRFKTIAENKIGNGLPVTLIVD